MVKTTRVRLYSGLFIRKTYAFTGTFKLSKTKVTMLFVRAHQMPSYLTRIHHIGIKRIPAVRVGLR